MKIVSDCRCNWPFIIVLLVFASYQGMAQAWQGDDLFMDELPVYLSVTRLPQNITEMPAAVTIIDRAMIEAAGAIELVDVFRLVPGFQVGYHQGADGQRAVVMSHGFTDTFARRMQVLIDGVSVYKASTGGPEWYDLPLIADDIERIEVIRGPNSATYGANSVVAVINIITRDASTQRGSRLSTTIGERRYRQYGLRHGDQFGDLDMRVSAEYLSTTGMVDNSGEDRLNDDLLTRRLNLRVDYRAGINDYLTLVLAGSNGQREVGVDNEVTDPRHQIPMESSMKSLAWKHIRDTDTDVTINLSHQRHETHNAFRVDLSPELYVLNDQSLQTERYIAELTHRFRVSDNSRLVWGLERRKDIVEGVSYFDLGNRYAMHSTNLSFNLEWRPQPSWIFNLGNMTENNDLFGTYHSPRLAINYLFNNGHYLRTAVGRAHRMPTIMEEKGEYNYHIFDSDGPTGMLAIDGYYFSAGGIRPEKQDSMELAVGMERQRMAYDIRLFHNRITDSISLLGDRRADREFDFEIINNESVNIRGIEFGMRMSTRKDSRIHLSYSHAHAEGELLYRLRDDDPVLRYRDMSSSVPRDTFGFLWDIRLDAQQRIGIGYYYVSSLEYLFGPADDTYDDVSTLDLNYRRQYRYGGMKGVWSVLLRDVSKSYFTGQSHLWRERQAFVNFSAEF